ncbi:MAG: hypothetical protein ACE5JN_13310 [Candidatus Methylomirabilia bacterium]
MEHPFVLIASLVALSIVYLFVPAFVLTFREYRGARRVLCPETETQAQVEVAAGRVALTQFFGAPRPKIVTCSLWPEWSGCGRRCLKVYAGATT